MNFPKRLKRFNNDYRKHLKIAAAALPEKLLKLHAALTIQASNLHFFNIFLQHREKLHAALILFRVKLRSFFRLFWEKLRNLFKFLVKAVFLKIKYRKILQLILYNYIGGFERFFILIMILLSFHFLQMKHYAIRLWER